MLFSTGVFGDYRGRQWLWQLPVHRKHNQPSGLGVTTYTAAGSEVNQQLASIHSLHEMIDFIKQLPHPRRAFWTCAPWSLWSWFSRWCTLRRRKEDSLLRMLPYYFKSSLYQIQSLRAQSCQRLLRPLWVLTVMMSVPQCHIATHMHTQCAVYSPVALWTHASRCARLHRQVTCFICCSFLLCFLRFIFLWQQ